jgi:hypothetical protein
MKTRTLFFSIGVLGAAAFFGAGVFAERHWLSNRLSGEKQVTEEISQKQKQKLFRAITKFRINRPPFATDGNSGNWFDAEFKVLTSREIMEDVTRSLNLEIKWGGTPGEAASRLERVVEAEQERGAEIVTLSAWSADREEAVQIADAMLRAYEGRRMGREADLPLLVPSARSDIVRQTGIVEKARLEMIETMKKYKIADSSPPPGSPGLGRENEPLCLFPVWSEETKQQMERDVARLAMLWKTLRDLKGESLLAAMAKLNIQNATLNSIGPEYRAEIGQLREATKKGLGAEHPKIRALKASTQLKFSMLQDAAEGFKSNLEVQLKSAQKVLADRKAGDVGHPAKEEREKVAEYAKAKYACESQLQLLNTMKEHALRAEAQTPPPPHKPIELLQEARLVEEL